MAEDPKSISKALNEMVDLLKQGNSIAKSSEGNALQEQESAKEEKRERGQLLNSISSLTDGFQKSFQSFVDKIAKPVGGGLFKGIMGLFGGLLAGGTMAALLGFFGPAGRLPLFAAKLLSLSSSFMGVIGKITPFLGPGGRIAKIGLKFLGPLMILIDNIVGAFRGFAESEESNFALRLVDAMKGAFSQMVRGLTFGLISFDTVSAFVDPFFENIKNFFGNVFAIVNDPELSIFQKIGLIFTEYLDYLKESIKIRLQLIVSAFSSLFDVVNEFFTIDNIIAAGEAFFGFFTSVGEWMFENFKRPVTFFAKQIDTLLSFIKEQFYSLVSAVLGIIPNVLKPASVAQLEKDFAEAASQEVQNRASTQAAYDQLLAQQDEEAFQQKVDAQEKRIARLKKNGDQRTADSEIANFDKRFGSGEDSARAKRILEGRNPDLFKEINTNQELQSSPVASSNNTNVVAPVTNIKNTTVASPGIRPRLTVGGEIPSSGLIFAP